MEFANNAIILFYGTILILDDEKYFCFDFHQKNLPREKGLSFYEIMNSLNIFFNKYVPYLHLQLIFFEGSY